MPKLPATISKRHHFVPQCYLKSFSLQKKKAFQVQCFDRVERRAFTASTTNVAAERYFNRIDIDGQPSDIFERAMASFEDELGPALQRIISAASLQNKDDRAILLNFICLLAIRNPRLRETMRLVREQTTRIAMDMVLSSKDRWEEYTKNARVAGHLNDTADISYEDMKEFFDKATYRMDVTPESHTGTEMRIFDQTLPLIFQRKWMLLKLSSRSGGFITSDHPFCLMWADPKMRSGLYPPGLAMGRTEAIVPISPRIALIGAFEIEEEERQIDDERIVAALNGATIASAHRQVYARDYQFRYVMKLGEEPRKASKLIKDRQYLDHEPDPEPTVPQSGT